MHDFVTNDTGMMQHVFCVNLARIRGRNLGCITFAKKGWCDGKCFSNIIKLTKTLETGYNTKLLTVHTNPGQKGVP